MKSVHSSTKAFELEDTTSSSKKRLVVKWGFLLLAALVAMYFWFSPTPVQPLYVHLVVFGLGPCLVLLDRQMPSAPSLRLHLLETAVRVLILLSLYPLLPPGTLSFIGYLVNSVLMYNAVYGGLLNFSIKPDHWLRYDNLLHTGFLTLLVVTIVLELGLLSYLKNAGIWFLMALIIALVFAWRSVLWNNVSQELSLAQHAAVWPNLAKRSTPTEFWKKMYNYSLQYPNSMPLCALRVLNVPVLLSFFKWTPGIDSHAYKYFQESIKLMVNEKEPRAVVFWQLYSSSEAASCIERIEEFTKSAQTEILELPTL